MYKPKELMLVLDCVRPLASRWKALAAFTAVFAGCAVAAAQTPPQLLPYTSRLIAGGGTQTTAAGGTCPISGNKATDAYGDGCLATEIVFSSAGATASKPYGVRYAVADAIGAVFFSDATAGLVRRIDPATGVVTAFAGGVTAAAAPASGAACSTGSATPTATDARGDGCLSTQVHLAYPMGLAIAANGDLLFTDVGQYDVRRVAAVNGVLAAAGGVITNVAGYAAGAATYGYVVSNATTSINAATGSYLDNPYGVAVDSQGDILIAEEYKNAILVVNPGTTTTTVSGVSVAPGTIVKIAGASTSGGSTCPNGSSGTNGCSYNPYTENVAANSTYLDSPFAVAVDPTGTVYIANEFNNVVPKVSTAGILSTYTGNQSAVIAKSTARGVAPMNIGSPFGLVADPYSNLYITDALNGVIWRVDGAGQYQYVVAGGATSTCTGAVDSFGDGCPATQATFGSTTNTSSKTGSMYATAVSPGIFGVTVDAAGDLYVGDTITNVVREITTNTQFGAVGGTPVTQSLEVHFASGDSASAYTLTNGSANFTLGSPVCTTNTDKTMDCLLPVTAGAVSTAATLGQFTGTLQVTSTLGGKNTFTLTGTHVSTPITRLSVTAAFTVPSGCTGTTISTATPVTLTASIVSTGSPTGTIQFFANGAAIGSPVAVSSSTATLTYTFSTTGSYLISATYSGDTNFNTSSTPTGPTIVAAAPSLGSTLMEAPNGNTVVQGQTGTYSFTLAQTVYTGTVTFSVTGLPANSTAVFSPTSITGIGCSTGNLVTLSVQTQLAQVKQAGLSGTGGMWRLLLTGLGVALVSLLGFRRRMLRSQWSRIGLLLALLVASTGLVACGKTNQGVSTPTGTYTLTVTATGSTGATSVLTTPMIVTAYQDPYH